MRTLTLATACLLTLGLTACTGEAPPDPGAQGETADPAGGDKAAKKATDTEMAKKAVDGDAMSCAGARPEPIERATLEPTPLPDDAGEALTDPSKATKTAPDTFKVKLATTAGDIVIEAHRDWSPNGADRLYNLVDIGYYDGTRFFRNIDGFMVQWGISGYPAVNEAWSKARIKDDPVVEGNKRGYVTFAKCGMPDCRSTQLFINHKDNSMLDGQGFAAVGKVVEGMDVVDKLYACYGEGAPRGMGPSQGDLQNLGNAYLEAGWPKLDAIKEASFVE